MIAFIVTSIGSLHHYILCTDLSQHTKYISSELSFLPQNYQNSKREVKFRHSLNKATAITPLRAEIPIGIRSMSPTVKRFPAVQTSYWVLALTGSLVAQNWPHAGLQTNNWSICALSYTHTYLSICEAEAEAPDDSFIIMLPDYADHHLAEAEPDQLLPESGID